MLIERNRRFTLSLMLAVMLCLSSCTTTSFNYCPAFPVGGKAVALELEKAGELPNTWEWIGRLDKLRQELEACDESLLRF